jgi:RNA polymerase sigma-70 factor, ECF subfamily
VNLIPEQRPSDGAQWAALLARVATEDRAAFSVLFRHFGPRVKSYMQRSGSSEAQAEELAQETMLTVWRKAAMFDPATSGAAAWIFTIARNLRIDAHRRERRDGLADVSDVELEFQLDESPSQDAQLSAIQSERRVRSALSNLSDEQLKVVELSFFDERAHAEIAKTLGIPLGTVKSRLRLAMGRLRSLVGEQS